MHVFDDVGDALNGRDDELAGGEKGRIILFRSGDLSFDVETTKDYFAASHSQ